MKRNILHKKSASVQRLTANDTANLVNFLDRLLSSVGDYEVFKKEFQKPALTQNIPASKINRLVKK